MSQTIELNGIPIVVEEGSHPSTEAFKLDWAQGFYPAHPLGKSPADVMRNTSISEDRTSTFLRFFGRYFREPLSSWIPAALAACGFPNDASFVVSKVSSADPITDGFLDCLAMAPSKDVTQSIDAATLIEAFVTDESSRFHGGYENPIERYIADLYDNLPREKYTDVMRYIDLPGFDNGTLQVGFGLLIRREEHSVRLWLWSRPVFYHK